MTHHESTMTRSEMTDLNRRFAEIFTGGEIDRIDDLVAEDFVDHNPAPGQGPGRQGIKDWLRTLRGGFSNLGWTIEDEIVERDLVVTRATMSGRHTGEFQGMPATDREFAVTSIDIVRVRDGKAVEHWGLSDDMSMLQQLGVVEPRAIPVGA